MNLIHLALKDIKLLFRDRMSAFFIFGFPIMMGLFFGMMMGGNFSGKRGKMEIAVVDQDGSTMSGKFVEALRKNDGIKVIVDQLETAMQSVRKANRTGMLVIPAGFGEKAGMFWEPQPEIQLGMDPSRTAESAMMEGFVMQAMGDLIGARFSNPRDFLPSIEQAKLELSKSLDANSIARHTGMIFFGALETMIHSASDLRAEGKLEENDDVMSLQFANVKTLDISREVDPNSTEGQVKKLRSKWDISFPQAMLWGMLGCVAGFSVSIAKERSQGTLVRLEASPLTRSQIMLGKALACFLSSIIVVVVMVLFGMYLGLRPGDFSKLAAAGFCVASCFVGIMMTVSVLGKTEQSVAGVGWAINMVMAMLGGCMVPVMFMPEFIRRFSIFSPVRWAILAIEGAIWRDFSWSELAIPLAILLTIGVLGFAIGSAVLIRRTN